MDTGNEEEAGTRKTMLGRCALASITKSPGGQVHYGCKECPAKYDDKELLEHHLFMHYNEFRYLCGICGVGLKRREHLERHTQGHLQVRPHACPECGKAFKRKEHLNIHRSIHTGDKNMNCSICNKAFYRKDHLQKHLQTHNKLFMKSLADGELVNFKEEPIDYDDKGEVEVMEYDEKSILPEEYISEEDIKIEIDESYIHPEVEPVQSGRGGGGLRPFACTVCDKTYKRRDHLKLHSFTHMKKENGCDECGKAFHSPELLLDHVSRVHGDDYATGGGDEGPVHSIIGTHLGPEFTGNELLVPRVPKEEHRPHECPVCHRRFKRRQHLKVHANVHAKVEPTIWCSLCHAGFFNNVQFEGHHCPGATAEVAMGEQDQNEQDADAMQPVTSIRDARKENNYPSEFIEVVEVEENVKIVDESHIAQLQDEEMNIPTPLRVFVCKYCSKPFKRKDHYRIHLHIHTGVKSFFCPHCQKGFYRKDHMKKHALVHEKPKPAVKAKPNAAAGPCQQPWRQPARPRRQLPGLLPIEHVNIPRKDVRPEITIHAPSNTKLRVPLSIKVPYKMVMSMDNGEQRAVTVDPHADRLARR